ncbi:hypothetical protein ACFUOZ_08710 [Paenarthrobacter sp. NPDC057355]|uniref:hypothetical protein n=1 Tax=Paenarthrobacter sp. NPDC057355 TaxID=3346105 RepID=UPI0036393350
MPERSESDAPEAGERVGGAPAEPQFGLRAPGGWTPPASQSQAAVPVHAAGENVVRGALFALAVVPLGAAAWLLLWNTGWMASIVAFIVATVAARLYVLGTGAIISRRGAWVVAGITLVTVLLSFWGGMLLDAAKFIGGRSPLTMLADAETWDLLLYNLSTNRDLVNGYAVDFLLALLFSALGCFFTLRQLFAHTRGS